LTLSVSVVVPAYDEGDAITPVLDRILDAVESQVEVLVVVDFADDSTVPVVRRHEQRDDRVKLLVSTYGRGPANAIRFGVDHAAFPILVITMADGSDDPRQIDPLARLVERGVVVAAASRYSAGGQQVGGPMLKALLSRGAGRSLGVFARVGTHDSTNSFKAYSTEFVRSVQIHSRSGFEIGLELTAKARRMRLPVAELPTIWLDRTVGDSKFDLRQWLPKYLRWYFFAFGSQLTREQVIAAADRIAARNNGTQHKQ
jgi:glycosyltransferase involved in cell wall biosynthesis